MRRKENLKADRKKNPYAVTWMLTVLCVVVTAVVGVVVMQFYRKGFPEETMKEQYDRYYVMITEEGRSSFWSAVYESARERAQEEQVYVDWLGDSLFEEYSREDLMRIAVASGCDGLIVTADESEEMTELIDEAVDVGIPVVTLYGDNTHSRRCSFVGIGSYNLGREYGRKALEIIERERIQGEETESKKETVQIAVLVNAYAQDLDQNILCGGIQEILEQENTEELQAELNLLPVDDTNVFSIEESIRDIFMEQELPDIIICLNELTTTCVYQAVVDYNKVGQVGILGYYDSDTILKAINRNVIEATAAIDTAQMGQFCIDALQEYHELGYTSQYFTADITLVTKENAEQYLEKEEAHEAE